MRFREIFRFELAYQLRRPWPWIFLAVLLVLSFLMTNDGSVADALYEDFIINAPFSIARTTVIAGLLWMMMCAAVAGEAGARDVATRMDPLVYTTPITRREYVGARFLAALFINAVLLLSVQVGILLAIYAPGVPAALIGPFRPAAFLTAYAYIALPNVFFVTAIQFMFATRAGRPMAAYVGSMLLFFTGFFIATMVRFLVDLRVGMMLDPIGINFIVDRLAHEWSTIEQNTRLLPLQGTVLSNRLVWVGVGGAAVAVTHLTFHFAHRIERQWPWQKLRSAGAADASRGPADAQSSARGAAGASNLPSLDIAVVPNAAHAVPSACHASGFGSRLTQAIVIARESFRSMATSWVGLAMLVPIPMLSVAVVISQMQVFGSPLAPTTMRVLHELTASFADELNRWVILPFLLIYFAGELVWRERESGLAEMTDAAPVPEWVPFIGKFLGIALLLVVFFAIMTVVGIVSQTILGYHHYQIPLYGEVFFGLQLPQYLLFVLLALIVHVIINQKYVAHMVAIVAYVFIALPSLFHVEHRLLIYGAGPGFSYSDMNGFGASIVPWLWFKLYWSAWALMLAVVARVAWVRGRENDMRMRLQIARLRLTSATLRTAALAVVLILTFGGFIFYNTNVLNTYRTTARAADTQAEYEHLYKWFEHAAQPRITATSVRVEIFPKLREAQIRGTYTLVNRTDVAIDSIHIATIPGVDPASMQFDHAASLVLSDTERGHRIYRLAAPLHPGDSTRLDFTLRIAPHGFTNHGADESVVRNGTWILIGNYFPAIGYQRSRELVSAGDRRAHGLGERPVVPSLYDVSARMEWAGPIAWDAVVGTDADQTAVAPGRLVASWTENGRRYFHYAAHDPIGSELGFFSARYALMQAKWNNVSIQFFHAPQDTAHLARMLRSVRASLDYYARNYGPYPRDYLSVVERSDLGTGMHSEAGMITHGSGFVTWSPKEDGEHLDFPFAIVAHEMSHEWNLPYAFTEGAPIMSESLAWYSAIQVVEEIYGRSQVRQLMHFMRQPYPYAPIRRGEPLLRGLDPYMSYRRGPYALFALSEYMGKDRVNAAIRRVYEKHGSGEPPLATTLDLYAELQAVTPDSLKSMLHDLFEVNTFWSLDAGRISVKQTSASTWQVTFDVTARKVVVDSAGTETEVPMNELVEVGVFGDAEHGDELGAPLYLQKQRIHSGKQTLTVTVTRKPVLAGIDPFHLLDWEEREDDNNIVSISNTSTSTN